MSSMRKLTQERERAVTVLTPPHRQVKDSPTAAVLMTGDTPQGCSYCHQNHSSGFCKVVTDVGLRKQILRKSSRCFVCLRKYHIFTYLHIWNDCCSSMWCPSCNGWHHSSICQKGSLRSANSEDQSAPSTTPSLSYSQTLQFSTSPTQEIPSRPPTEMATTSMCSSIRSAVLLQTARAVLFQPDRLDILLEARIIFHCGIQRSYLMRAIKNTLLLPTESIETMIIKTFGSDQGRVEVCDLWYYLILFADYGWSPGE